MAWPSKEAPRPTPSCRHGSRVARLVRGILPLREERPPRWRPQCHLRGQDSGSRRGVRATPANIISAVCGDTNPDACLLFTKGVDGVPISRVLLQVTMCPRSRGRPTSFAGGLIAQLEDVRLLAPTFVRLPALAFYVKKGRGSGSCPDGASLRSGRRRSGEAPGTLRRFGRPLGGS